MRGRAGRARCPERPLRPVVRARVALGREATVSGPRVTAAGLMRPRARDRRRRIERRRGGQGPAFGSRWRHRSPVLAPGRRDEVDEVLGPHHDRARDLLGQDPQHDLAEANEVALLELRPFDLLAVHEDAVGALGVADGEPVRAGLDHGMPARALHVVQDEVARGIASEDREGALELDLVRLSRRGTEPRIAWPSWADSIRGSSRLGSRGRCSIARQAEKGPMITSEPQQRGDSARRGARHPAADRTGRGQGPRPGPRSGDLPRHAGSSGRGPSRRPPWPGASSRTSASSRATSRPRSSSTRASPGSTWRPGPSARPTPWPWARATRACPSRARWSRPTPPTPPSSSRASRTTSARPAFACSPPSTRSSRCAASGSASSGWADPTTRAARSATPTSRSSPSSRRSGCGASSTRSIRS